MEQDTRTQDESTRLSTDDLAGRPEPVEQDPDPARHRRDPSGGRPAPLRRGRGAGQLKEPLGLHPDELRQRSLRQAVEEADALVADLMTRLAQSFSEERKGLEGQWDRGTTSRRRISGSPSGATAPFFDRLLAA